MMHSQPIESIETSPNSDPSTIYHQAIMRVGIGTILSVLSFSVLAAVIPNYDDHGILLVRRTVDPDPMDLLWKRADEDQEGSEPSGSEADTSAGTSGNSQPGKKGGLLSLS
ncbi:hypothetical protein BASA62_005687 [Batrachochytrium salamandrivorans]|nr:hypothetical protein BASA62_005687 [Batrachochytrium salamandrivorans]